jgi:hypothetical protein
VGRRGKSPFVKISERSLSVVLQSSVSPLCSLYIIVTQAIQIIGNIIVMLSIKAQADI